jgi:Cu2+-exporting ATPase/Cu+-exporting ATPase
MSLCTHCDERIQHAVFDETDSQGREPFCCRGCLTVYQLIHEKGLGEYYSIKRSSSTLKARAPVQLNKQMYRYLDDFQFLNEYTYLNSHQERVAEFYLEGVHCLACLWLIERLPDLVPHVQSAKLDMGKSIVTVVLSPAGLLSAVALELSILGYRPHPLKNNETSKYLKLREERWQLLRIGIAAAGASNIMLYAVSLYAGAEEDYGFIFNLLTVLFAIPVLSFSAWPFYQSAWRAIKTKTISIDVPISMALILGAIMGVYSLIIGVHENYFDSLTALVFLLLISRYFLKKIQEKGLAAQDLHFFYHTDQISKAENSALTSFKDIHPKYVMPEDVVKIGKDEHLPIDGVVLSGSAELNTSLLTGESLYSHVSIGDEVFAGTQLVNGEILVRVLKTTHETRLGEILKSVEKGWMQKAPVVELTQKISSYFLWTVLLAACVLFAWQATHGSMVYALEMAITLLIVTCPCALAIGTPLAFTRALGMAAKNGMVIKNDAVIEKLGQVKTIVFDKTGTLTYGEMQIERMQIHSETSSPLSSIILTLEAQSKHPIARALVRWAQKNGGSELPLKDFSERIGVGVRGVIDQQVYEIKNYQIYENGQVIADFSVSDQLRPEVPGVLRRLAQFGFKLKLLSGDKQEIVADVAQSLGSHIEFKAELSPENKHNELQKIPHAMMVGDGANDAIALTRADVGVAVNGSMDITLRAADVYLISKGINNIPRLIILGQETMKVIRRNLVLSLSYNAVSLVAVFAGLITPLVAAIIMPLSSLTILLSTLWGSKNLRMLWK